MCVWLCWQGESSGARTMNINVTAITKDPFKVPPTFAKWIFQHVVTASETLMWLIWFTSMVPVLSSVGTRIILTSTLSRLWSGWVIYTQVFELQRALYRNVCVPDFQRLQQFKLIAMSDSCLAFSFRPAWGKKILAHWPFYCTSVDHSTNLFITVERSSVMFHMLTCDLLRSACFTQ